MIVVLLLWFLVFVNYGLTLGFFLWDRARLTDEQRARAWKLPATWGAAVYNAPFSAIPWVWVTRQEWAKWCRRGIAYALAQSVWLLLKGAAAAALLFALYLAIGTLLMAALGVDVE